MVVLVYEMSTPLYPLGETPGVREIIMEVIMQRITWQIGIFSILLTLALPSFAQQATLDILTGKTAPLTLKLGQLDGAWRCISPTPPKSGADTFLLLIASSQSHQPLPVNVMYTKGDTVAAGGEVYLIAYNRPPQPQPTEEQMQRREAAKPVPLTADSELTLCLLNIRTMGSLLDIRPFDLQQELAENKEQAKMSLRDAQTASLNNLRQLAIAVQIYAQDHDQTLPPMDNAERLKVMLKIDLAVFTKPGTNEPYQPNAALGGKKLAQLPDPAQVVVYYEATPWPNGLRCVAFLDSHVEVVADQKWAELKEKMARP